jgi:oxygen-dependent protoporphyrinogen oxidase
VLLRIMIGGARDPEALSLPDDALMSIVRSDLARTMNLSARAEMTYVIRHQRGIPQYVQGHLARLGRIDRRLAEHPGLLIGGNSYRGVSINSCIAEAETIAESVIPTARLSRRELGQDAAVGAASS